MKKIAVLFTLLVSLFFFAFSFGLTDKVILRVGDSTLTQSQLDEKIAALPQQYQEYYSSIDGKKILIDSIKKEYLVYEMSNKAKYDTNKEVLAQIENIKKQVMVAQYLKDNIESKIKVSAKDAKKYYDENKDMFKKDDQIKARHILVATEKEAKDIIAKLNKGESFQALAREFSMDPGSKVNGGDLGWFAKGQMVKPFETAAFALKKGEYTKQEVQTQYGYHVIFVEDKKDAEQLAYKDVSTEIENYLKQNSQKEALDALLKDAAASVKVEDFSEQLFLKK
ncbi:MAG: peptidylprolyl isomerase [Candidatus Margulisbacteria bacterium]|nr:peptidylprolyl isomerase [Candidatus Margulisiibacteriota bacterium]